MPEDDAKFLIKNFVIPRLNSIDNKLEKIESCQVALKIEDERIKHSAAKNELLLAQTQEAFLKHCNDTDKHFNPYFNESMPQKLWRKKPEIATGVSLSTILITLILKILEVI